MVAFSELGIVDCVILFEWTLYIWQTYLNFRQYRVYKTDNVPLLLVRLIDTESFEKCRQHELDHIKFRFLWQLYHQVHRTLILYLYGMKYLWNCSGWLLAYFSVDGPEDEMLQSLTFVFLVELYVAVISLPWELYRVHVIEKRHGFANQNVLTSSGASLGSQSAFFVISALPVTAFLLSLFVNLATIAVLIGTILIILVLSGIQMLYIMLLVVLALLFPLTAVAFLLHFVQATGPYFFIYTWISIVALTLLSNLLMSSLIAAGSSGEPLPNNSLRSQVEEMARSVNFPANRVFVYEGSPHPNAYQFGFNVGTRIMLDNRLVARHETVSAGDYTQDEVLAILAHEIGHWKLNHAIKTFIIAMGILFIQLMLFALLIDVQRIYDAFGFHDSKPTIIGLIIISRFLLEPYEQLSNLVLNAVSRCFEYQADEFAATIVPPATLSSGIVKLSRDNRAFPLSDWLYTAWYHTHPSAVDRLAALDVISHRSS